METNDSKVSLKENIIAFLVFFGIIVFIIGLFVCANIEGTKRSNEDLADLENIQSKNIQSCVLSSDVREHMNGAFILGTGSFQNNQTTEFKYYLYIEGNKGYKLQNIEAKFVELVPTDEIYPHIEGHFDEYGDVFSFKTAYERKRTGQYSNYCNEMIRYTIYVPTNYITEEYQLDITTAMN